MPESNAPKNHNAVPRAQWRKWGNLSRHVFNEVYGTMAENQGLFLHPKARKNTLECWNTTAWNAAWIAADAAKEA
jgi:hypothetical protein